MEWRRDGTTRIERGDQTIGLSSRGEPITALAWSPDGERLAVAAARRIELWSIGLR